MVIFCGILPLYGVWVAFHIILNSPLPPWVSWLFEFPWWVQNLKKKSNLFSTFRFDLFFTPCVMKNPTNVFYLYICQVSPQYDILRKCILKTKCVDISSSFKRCLNLIFWRVISFEWFKTNKYTLTILIGPRHVTLLIINDHVRQILH